MNANLKKILALRANTQDRVDQLIEYNDDNNCTVVAFQMLTGVSYIDAYKILKNIRAATRRGIPHSRINDYIRAFNVVGFNAKSVSRIRDDGRFLVLTMSHAYAVIDGKAYNSDKNYIMYVYEISKNTD